MKRPLRIAALATLAVLAFLAVYYRLPYYAEGPGPARQVAPLIEIEDHERYDSEGELVMTTVRFYRVTALQALFAWFDPEKRVIHESVLYPPGQDPDTERERAISQMDQSKIDATFVVMEELTAYPRDHGAGALIEGVANGCPASGQLYAGDLVTAVEGDKVTSRHDADKAIDEVPDDEAITFTVRAAGETHDVDVTRRRCVEGEADPLIGISLVNPFPFPVTISSGDIGGPSAGLMFALGLYDALTPEDITGGSTIAGTGEIHLDGTVGPIGGIADKVIAAERAGASVMLVPADNMEELRGRRDRRCARDLRAVVRPSGAGAPGARRRERRDPVVAEAIG